MFRPTDRSPAIAFLALVSTLSAAGCEQTAHSTPEPLDKTTAKTGQAQLPSAPPKKSNEEPEAAARVALFPALQQSVDQLTAAFDAIPGERRKQLKKLALFVETKKSSGETADIIFICTHNSRRSHLSQLWAATAAAYYGVTGVKTFSGGTEATAFNPRAVAAVKRAGFQVEVPGGESKNPHYEVRFSDQAATQKCFSKKYDDPANPASGFAAVMTCSQADKNCPTVEGAALRVALPFVDPKESDGTPEETATYDARSRQIGTEMFYLFSLVSKKG